MNANKTGVYKAQRKDKSIYYRVSVTYRNKHISLGSFDNEKDAGYAYTEAWQILKDSQITIEKLIDYIEYYHIDFEKCITLINFRDNGMYLSTPIYISRKLFYYYLSPYEVMKFDADELFFYSSHKISRRGNHFFVADYGKQINLFSRYGIRPNAVQGRDYRFKNGDSLDFRIANIEIINVYYGVSPVIDRKKHKFKAVIHLKNNFTIGHFDTKEEAAIAYNKCADFLDSQNYTKKYPRNNIEGMDAKDYEAIYNSIKLPAKITGLFL